MEIIILAGGLGTRLREIVADLPKPMAPVMDKPFLYYIFRWLQEYPVKKVILSTGYKSESISDYFGSLWGSINIEYVKEEIPLGTGGAIMNALSKTSGSDVLILNGDTYFPININKFYSSHKNNNNPITIALKRMKNFERYGTVECSDGSVIRFNEKKFCPEGLINGGIYLLSRNFLETRSLPAIFSFEKEILEKEAGSSSLKGLIFNNSFIDIGIPEDYYRAESILKKY
jgi:D-glycero-alpha-D-manno-heptose 1-phosphate guanylyltransferase